MKLNRLSYFCERGAKYKNILYFVRVKQKAFLRIHFLSLILIFTLASASNTIIGQTKKEDPVKLQTDLVSINVSVTDSYGRYVTGLKSEHFEVFEDKIKQKVELFSDDDAPVSIGIVYDTSGSMKEKLRNAYKSLTTFFETGHKDDDIFLITFSSRAKLSHDFTTNHQGILNSLVSAESKGPTALYDGVYIGVEKVQQGRHAKKALLIISDGQDNASRYSYKELRDRTKEADVIIYAIGITDIADSFAAQGRAILEELTRMTGGRAFFPTFSGTSAESPELSEIVTRIALELRHQYALGYYPTNAVHDGGWRKIKIKVNAPKGVGKLNVAYKEGYRAPQS